MGRFLAGVIVVAAAVFGDIAIAVDRQDACHDIVEEFAVDGPSEAN